MHSLNRSKRLDAEKHQHLPEITDLWNVWEQRWIDAQANKKKKQYTPYDIKIGHGGTLDPLASGVLVIGIGTGTKDLGGFQTGNYCRKTYEVTGQFGICFFQFKVAQQIRLILLEKQSKFLPIINPSLMNN